MWNNSIPPPPQNYARPAQIPPMMQQQQQQQYQYQYGYETGAAAAPPSRGISSPIYTSGKRKALLIGINYFNSKNQLRGCINDVRNMQQFLIQKGGYRSEDMVILTDDSRNPMDIPTRNNMLRAMEWLVSNAAPGDCLFFHYSGHGGEEKDLNGDEVDGRDECIYPVDFQQNGSIIDDIMHDILVKRLPQGCRLTAIFDSCHSGTVLDLPFMYRAQDGGLKEYNIWKEGGTDGLEIMMGYSTRNVGMMMTGAKSLFEKASNYKSKSQLEAIKQSKISNADVIMFSGCRDDQTSADANEAGTFTGAMSWAFLGVMSQLPPGQNYSYLTLLQGIRQIMKSRYTQKPQMSSSHQMDPNALFMF
jgi:hypothetical protein